MVDVKDVDLLALQSRYMQGDITTQALCAALNPIIQDLGSRIPLVMLYPMIDKLSGNVLDELAWGFHVDAYNALADDAEKRRMIKNSFMIHKFKGTVYAVRKIVESVFEEAGFIEEWFQYNGNPYHFRVDVYCQSRGVTAADQLRALRLVEAGKNLRSEIDGIRLILSQGVNQTIAAVGTWGALLEVYPIGEINTHMVKVAATASQTATISVYELEE